MPLNSEYYLGEKKMLLQKENSDSQIRIKSYTDRKLTVSGKTYKEPILLSASELSLFDKTDQFSKLTAEMLLPSIPQLTEIIIIGCGENQQFLPMSEIKQINDKGIAIEIMGTRQACHTFQVLAYENRKVIALLFP